MADNKGTFAWGLSGRSVCRKDAPETRYYAHCFFLRIAIDVMAGIQSHRSSRQTESSSSVSGNDQAQRLFFVWNLLSDHVSGGRPY